MQVNLVVAVTDGGWFDQLRNRPDLEEVNFWSPSPVAFRALVPGELFLFKLHAPRNFIVGGGVFAYATTLPCSLAWEAFGAANGASSLSEMRARIGKLRRENLDTRSDFQIGCRILTQPFFFDEPLWIPAPTSFARNIVSFKRYRTNEVDGLRLWEAVHERLHSRDYHDAPEVQRFRSPTIIHPRLGQGAFRVVVTDAYQRRCAITRERTLPALEAAHIRPYSEGGLHRVSNGLLLRRDIHSLFDAGYVTVTPDLRFEVSRTIRDEFENGKEYYRFHGAELIVPSSAMHRPDKVALRWHNETRYRG